MVHRAAKTALAPPTGPVFLSLPGDILNAEDDIELGAPTRVAPSMRADAQAIEAAAALLAAAERPVIIAGAAVAQRRAHRELVELAELIGAPVFAEGVANTASFPASHPLFRGTIARLATSWREALSEYDLLFSVGGDLFTLSLPSGGESVPPGLKIIHLDIDAWELGKNYPAGGGPPRRSGGDAPRAHARLGRAHDRRRARARARALRGGQANGRRRARGYQGAGQGRGREGAHSALGAACSTRRDAAGGYGRGRRDALLGAGPRRLLKSDDPQSYYGLGGGGIGWGLPAAIGVKLALPERAVVALIGDGSAMYSCQALWTAAHYRIGVVFVIFNNRSYRILKQRVNALKGHAAQSDVYVGMDLVDPAIDYVGLARALGIKAEHAETTPETIRLMEEALASGAPALIDVAIDPAFKPV